MTVDTTFGKHGIIVSTILSGSVDDNMRGIELAIKQRKEYLKQRMIMRLRMGVTDLLQSIKELLDSVDNTGCDGLSVVDQDALDNLEVAYWNYDRGV